MALETESEDGAVGLFGDAAVVETVSGDGVQGATEIGADKSGEGGGAPAWFEKLSAQAGEGESSSNRDYAQAKGFKDLDGVFKSLRHAEKAIHDKGMVALPKEGAKPEEIAAFRAAIGVPDKVEGYQIKAPEGVPLNEPLINLLRESALRHGAPKGAFEGLVNDYVQMQLDDAAAAKAQQDVMAKDWVKGHGAKGEAMKAQVASGMRVLGLSVADSRSLYAALGADRTLNMLSKIGAGTAEDTFTGSNKTTFGVTGAEAQVELDRLKADTEFAKKAMVPGSAEKARWDRLNAAAAAAAAAKVNDY